MEYYSLGIDPGWKNLGYAIVYNSLKDGIRLVEASTLNPSDNPVKVIHKLRADLRKYGPRYACIERYVSYQGVTSAETENILMLIGGMYYQTIDEGTFVHTVRAIDWKTDLVKNLVIAKGFDNPSSSLDKKFSMAAAKACLTEGDFKNDHEADAICLACSPILAEKAQSVRKAKSTSRG